MSNRPSNPGASPLLTDLYQLTMLQAYFENDMDDTAVFEFFVRKSPPQHNFLLALGLQQALEFLTTLQFQDDELVWLEQQPFFKPEFIAYLAQMSFTGDVEAMPEGTVFFPDEPILRVIAPISQAQLVESRIINLLQFQTLVGSRAARIRLCAGEHLLVDFGFRRAHGAEAGLLAARAAYLGGFDGTATVLAGKKFDIPLYGTMAHSFIQAHPTETDAFLSFARAQPDNVVLLIDTYDTEQAARQVVEVAPQLRDMGMTIKGVRLDSGDLGQHARRVRNILDDGDLANVTILASSNLDEYQIQDLLEQQAPIDGFGVGTQLTTAAEQPYLDCAYKLQEYAGVPRRKRSERKATWPGRKQVYRYFKADGTFDHDSLTTLDDQQNGQALLNPVMRNGKSLHPQLHCEEIRHNVLRQLDHLPPTMKHLQQVNAYPVEVSSTLRALSDQVDRPSVG